jgi:hypothetical protein
MTGDTGWVSVEVRYIQSELDNQALTEKGRVTSTVVLRGPAGEPSARLARSILPLCTPSPPCPDLA